MPFTEKFIKLPTKIYNAEEAELTGSKRLEKSVLNINPLDISVYFDSFDKDGDRCVQIETKGGGVYAADITIQEFEKILNSHFQ